MLVEEDENGNPNTLNIAISEIFCTFILIIKEQALNVGGKN